MAKFKTLNKLKSNDISLKHILYSCFIIIGLLSIFVFYKSYAIYKLEQDYDIIKNKIGTYSMGDVRVAVLIDGKETDTFPTYETNYKVESIECSNGVTATFDVENWQLNIADMSATSTKCTVNFNSKEKNEVTPVNMTKTELLALNEDIKNTSAKELANYLYPVGSIYLSTTDSSVDDVVSKFGGTWVRYGEDTTLVGYKEGSNEINATGGSKTVTLATANLPSHTHDVTAAGTVTSKFTGTRALSESTGSGYSIGYTYANRNTSTTGAHTHPIYVQKDLAKAAMGSAYYRIGNSSGGSTETWATGSAAAGNHYHTYPDYYANSISGVAAHQHYYTAAGTVASTFTGTKVTSTATGSGTAVNVQDPYTVVYMYKRTA